MILGAGFSHAAGLPLAKNLFEQQLLVASNEADRKFQLVWEAWDEYKRSDPGKGSEQFLRHLYDQDASGNFDARALWGYAVELVAAVLGRPYGDDIPIVRNPRYAGRVTTRVRSSSHVEFWNAVFTDSNPQSVVTTNYDLLAERGIRHRPMKLTKRPGFFYGGFPRPQRLKGLAQPWTVLDPQRVVTLEGSLPIYKLHGSLSWSSERGALVMYQDQRPAFRAGSSKGGALIIPPLPEKEVPSWLVPVWDDAIGSLRKSPVWIVCGYSLPDYDKALEQLFRRATHPNVARTILLMDPNSTALRKRWQAVAPAATIVPLPGLPAGIEQLSRALARLV